MDFEIVEHVSTAAIYSFHGRSRASAPVTKISCVMMIPFGLHLNPAPDRVDSRSTASDFILARLLNCAEVGASYSLTNLFSISNQTIRQNGN